MILIGMFDSPFVRRVAVSMDVLGMPFEHRDWSTGRDATGSAPTTRWAACRRWCWTMKRCCSNRPR